MTNRLCQDPIENLFSIFRQKGGYCKNPTVRTLRNCFASVCSFGLLNCASDKSNCEEDDDVFLNYSQTPMQTDMDNNINNKTDLEYNSQFSSLPIYSSSDSESTPEEEPPNHSTTLEKCSMVYYAGYLAKKCLDKFQCEECHKYLLKSNKELDDKNQLLILYKTFEHIELNSNSGLKAPSENLEHFIKICSNVFIKNYKNLKSEKHLVDQLMTQANHIIPEQIVSQGCVKHFEYIMKMFFIVNIFKECKWSSINPKRKKITSQKPNEKLRILQHF